MSLAKYGLALRSLGSHEMMEILRIPPMCVADWVRESFESELLCASLAQSAVFGTWCGPWSPGTATNLLVRECTAGKAVRGGAPALIDALSRAATSAGVEVRTGCEVDEIVVNRGVASGVILAGGERIGAAAVVSSADPRNTFLRLVRPQHIDGRFERNLESWRARGTTATVNLALSAPLEFACRPGLRVEYARTGQTLDGIERAFDAVKYRRASENPVLDIFVPTVSTPGAAPDGHEVVSIVAHFAPYDLEGGWTDAAREALGDAVVAALERFAPGVSASLVARQVRTPKDIEERYGTTGGHVHHGEHALDQLITRPTPETARYASPIENLYTCGSGAHPGGGVTCAPGTLAARQVRTG
jgi:phytoene dehydrogenase-like protein